MKATTFKDIDEYISGFPAETQTKLEQMRSIIQKAAPKAKETISYNMPAFKTEKVLVYFAGYKNHIGFYPAGSGILAFKNEIKKYKNSKGAVQFPLSESLPAALISKMVKFKLQEVASKQKLTHKETFLTQLSAPAQRALSSKNIKSELQLSKYKESEIAELHGMGPTGIALIKKALKAKKLSFKK